MKWVLKDSQIIGGMRAAHLRAPFSRAQVVLASKLHPNARLIVHHCLPSGEAEGDQISEEDWRDLITAEESLELQKGHIAAVSHLVLWLVRSNFEERETAMSKLRERKGAIVHEENHGDVYVLIVDESLGEIILNKWAKDAFDKAYRLAGDGDWLRAAIFAHLSWILDIGWGLERTALYILALEKTAGSCESEGVIALETNSRNKEDMTKIHELLDRYRNHGARIGRQND